MNAPPSLLDRTRARRAALQMLYQWEVGGRDAAEVVQTYWTLDRSASAEPGPEDSGTESPELRTFAEDLTFGTVNAIAEIDPLISAHAEHWRLSRMAVIDRAILRLSVYQLLARRDTPPSVVINEALELARMFSTEEAVAFVNGVLDAIHRSLHEEDAGKR